MSNISPRRVSKTEMQVRIEYITDLIAQGKQRSTIVELIGPKWAITPVTARLYVRKSLSYISELLGQERMKQLGKAIVRYEYLYKECVDKKEYRTALAAQDSLSKLLSLDKVVVTERKGEPKGNKQLGDEYQIPDSL